MIKSSLWPVSTRKYFYPTNKFSNWSKMFSAEIEDRTYFSSYRSFSQWTKKTCSNMGKYNSYVKDALSNGLVY